MRFFVVVLQVRSGGGGDGEQREMEEEEDRRSHVALGVSEVKKEDEIGDEFLPYSDDFVSNQISATSFLLDSGDFVFPASDTAALTAARGERQKTTPN